MTYQPPSLESLHKFISTLETTTHSERKQAIQHLKPALEIKDRDSVLGYLILETEKIDVEYKRIPILSSVYLATRSDLYQELNSKRCLNNTIDNPLDAKQKLIYLWQYYQSKKNALIESKEEKNSVLDDEFKPVIDNLLIQIPDLKVALNERPSLIEISKRLQERPKKYEAECKDRWISPTLEHMKFNKLLQLLSSPMLDALIATLEECKTPQDQEQFKYSVYYGALLYIMKQIECDCSGITMRKPENSSLYTFCQQTLNIQHSNDIPDVVKLNFFVDFGRLIKCARSHKETIKILKSFKISEAGYILGPTYFLDADNFLDAISLRLHTLLTEDSYLWSCLKCLGNYAIQTLIVTACLEMGAGIYAAGIGVDVLPFIFGKLGRQFMGGAVGERVAKIFAAQIEPAFMTDVYANTIWFTGTKVHKWLFPPIDPIFFACEISKKFRSQLHEEIATTKKPPNVLLLALVGLPSTRISSAVKKRITGIIIDAPATQHSNDIEFKQSAKGMKKL